MRAVEMGRKSQVENDLGNSTGHGPLGFGMGVRKRKDSWKALRLPTWVPGCWEGRRGSIGWEDDDLYLLEIKLAWKKYFSSGVIFIPNKFLCSSRRLQITC